MDQLYDTEPGQPRVPLRATPEGYLIVQIAGGGGGRGSSVTNLTTTVSPTNVVVASDTGTDATIPLADVTNAGAMPPAAVTQLAGLGTASEADVEDFAAPDHTHALLMTTDERTKLGALPAAADLTTSLAGKMANTLPAMQTVFNAGTAPEKAAFQASVSGYSRTAGPWADRPAAGSIGDEYFATDLGSAGILFRWSPTFTRWRLANDLLLLARHTEVIGVTSGGAQILASAELPAGLLRACSSVSLQQLFAKSGTVDAATNMTVRIGTTGTVADATIVSVGNPMSAANWSIATETMFRAISATEIAAAGQAAYTTSYGGAGSGAPVPANLTIPDSDANDLIISTSITMAGTTNFPISKFVFLQGFAA